MSEQNDKYLPAHEVHMREVENSVVSLVKQGNVNSEGGLFLKGKIKSVLWLMTCTRMPQDHIAANVKTLKLLARFCEMSDEGLSELIVKCAASILAQARQEG